MEEKNINTWVKIADEDFDTAEYCFNGKKYLWSMVMCQQAIEKHLNCSIYYLFIILHHDTPTKEKKSGLNLRKKTLKIFLNKLKRFIHG